MIARLWTTAVREGRERDYLEFANSRSRAMFAAAPGCLGVLFLDHGDGRHSACSFWKDAAAIEAFTASQTYKETVAAILATGSLGPEQTLTLGVIEPGSIKQVPVAREHSNLDALVHHHILSEIIATGRAPDADRLATLTSTSTSEIQLSLHRLHDNHALVLHPDRDRVWVIHPFALWPTGFVVTAGAQSWWGNCAWCSLGVAAILRRDVVITTTLGGETERVEFRVVNGEVDSNLVVHFSRPVARAWDNVIYYCGTVLTFRSHADVDRWCEKHGIEKGEVVPMRQVWDLAKKWYGNHLAPDWKKWTPAEAQRIFDEVGLTGTFWHVPQAGERF